MKKKNTTKTKLFATIISMVSALALLAVGVFATLTNFQVAIANQLNLKFDAVEGTLYATRVGDVAGTDRTTSKVLSESTTATDWLKVYDGTTAEGVQDDAIASIQEKVDFISNDKIKDKVDAGGTSIAITYYFYYTLPTSAVANNIILTAPTMADSNVVVSYSYIKTTGAALPDFTDGTALNNGSEVTISGGEHLFIKAEAKVDISKSVKIENADWKFTLSFGISTYNLSNGVLTFNAVYDAETYEVWAKPYIMAGASLLAKASKVGDTDSTLGTLVAILDKDTTSVNLAEALTNIVEFDSGTYNINVLPMDTTGAEVTGFRTVLNYDHLAPQPIKSESGVYTIARPLNGIYYYYVELGEYPQAVIEDAATISALNALGDSAKTGRTFTVGASEDSAQTTHEEYTYNGAKYVKVASAVVRDKDSKFASGVTPTNGDTYWFKVEPIKWYLLESYSTTKTAYSGSTTNIRVVSEKMLTANVMFGYKLTSTTSLTANSSNSYLLGATTDASNYGNEWGKSNVRAWLNDAFYTSAFSAEDKTHIVKNTTRYFGTDQYTRDDDYTVTTGGSTAEDNVWLLSYHEVTSTYYGANMYLKKNTRQAVPTDFAVANNMTMYSNGCGWYWLRSAGSSSSSVYSVSHVDGLSSRSANLAGYGVRPALTISL